MSLLETNQIHLLSRVLDLTATRHQLIASNLANIDTPNFKTRDLNFAAELHRASNGVRWADYAPAARQVVGLLERPDGNNVNIDRETLLLAQNQLRFRAAAELLRSEFRRLSLAINEGK